MTAQLGEGERRTSLTIAALAGHGQTSAKGSDMPTEGFPAGQPTPSGRPFHSAIAATVEVT